MYSVTFWGVAGGCNISPSPSCSMSAHKDSFSVWVCDWVPPVVAAVHRKLSIFTHWKTKTNWFSFFFSITVTVKYNTSNKTNLSINKMTDFKDYFKKYKFTKNYSITVTWVNVIGYFTTLVFNDQPVILFYLFMLETDGKICVRERQPNYN